jgi:ribose 5-phosphate isomerase
MIFDTIKANLEIGKLNKVIADLKTDRDLQLSRLKDFEVTNKDFMDSSQTYANLKKEHKKEIEALKTTIETMKLEHSAALLEKEAEVNQRVVQESINLVSSQGTNVIIDTANNQTLTPEAAYQKLQSLTGEAKQAFYVKHETKIRTLLKK